MREQYVNYLFPPCVVFAHSVSFANVLTLDIPYLQVSFCIVLLYSVLLNYWVDQGVSHLFLGGSLPFHLLGFSPLRSSIFLSYVCIPL